MVTLRKHQLEGKQFIHQGQHLGALLFHGLGLGKTLTSLIYCREKLAALRSNGVIAPKFMVILPKSASITWQTECQTHTSDIYRDMLLIPYSQLNKAPKLILYYDIRVVVMDESHYVRTPNTNRAKDLATMLDSLSSSKGQFKNGKIIMLSGTPMLNSASELYTTWAVLASPNCAEAAVRLLDESRYDKWARTFSEQKEKRWKTHQGEKKGSVYSGVANPELLQELLAPITHYRRVEDCISLPEKQDAFIDLNLPDDKLLKDANIEEPDAFMAILERLAQAKTPYLLEWVKDFLHASQEQLVVFATHRFPLQALQEKYPNQVVLVTGEQTGSERTANIEDFQNNKKRIIALTYRAGSESLNLQNCNHALYFSYPWTSGNLRQAVGRIYRSGQKKFTLHTYLTSGQNDRKILGIVQAKGEATSIIESHLLAGSAEIDREYALDSFI